MSDDEEMLWIRLCEKSKEEFHGEALSFDEYMLLFYLTEGFQMSPKYAADNIWKQPNCANSGSRSSSTTSSKESKSFAPPLMKKTMISLRRRLVKGGLKADAKQT